MRIVVDDLTGPEIAAMLEEHLADMAASTPEPESRHALDLAALRAPEITFWSVWDGDELVGCGAVKLLSDDHGELKSMRTSPARRRGGVASALLAHILDHARATGLARLSLETGSGEAHAPARALYAGFGFTECEPFAHYRTDPNSTFMTRSL